MGFRLIFNYKIMRFRRYTMRRALVSGWGFRMPKWTGWVRYPQSYIFGKVFQKVMFSWFTLFKWLFK